MTGEKHLETVELENKETHERRTEQTPAVFSMIGAKPCTDWLPPEIERDDKGFVKTGAAVADAPAWKAAKRPPGPLETSRPGIFAAGRRPFGFGEALRRRRGRRRHGRGGSASSARRIPVIPSPVRTPSSLGALRHRVNLGATNEEAK
jgi:hypothetical protein